MLATPEDVGLSSPGLASEPGASIESCVERGEIAGAVVLALRLKTASRNSRASVSATLKPACGWSRTRSSASLR